MAIERAINIEIQGVRLRLISENSDCLDFVRLHTDPYLSKGDRQPNIEVRFRWNKLGVFGSHRSGFEYQEGLNKVGRRILTDGNGNLHKIFDDVPGLEMLFTVDKEDNLSVAADYHFRPGLGPVQSILNSVFFTRRLAKQRSEIARLIFYLVYYPVLWYLDRHRSLYVIHGSAVKYKDEGIILTGIPGVGKSTLTLSLLSCPDARLLSDNILLYDDKRVYSCYESVRLDKRSLEMLPDLSFHLSRIGSHASYDRDFYEINKASMIDSVKPTLLFIPQLSDVNGVRPISLGECVERTLAFNHLAGEMRRYASFSAALNLLRIAERSQVRMAETLEKLLQNVRCYELSVRARGDLRATLEETILKLI